MSIILLIYILLLTHLFCIKYPLNENIEKSEMNVERVIEIVTNNQLFDYLSSNNYVISVFYSENEDFLDIFHKASSYTNFNKWVFVKISCITQKNMCNQFNIQNFPTYKAFVFSKEIKIYYGVIKNSLADFLELLNKLSSNPIIDIDQNSIINSKEIFYKNYGTFSPFVEYNRNKGEFISCIYILAKKKYLQNFYFGVQAIKENNNDLDEKIIFNYNNMPVSMGWKGDCDEIDTFLNKNLYPLINEINLPFIEELKYKKDNILIIVSANLKNKNINNFIFKNLKTIAHDNRRVLFGYIDNNGKIKDIIGKLGINNINTNNSDIQIIVYNFYENLYYIDQNKYNINKVKEIENEIMKLVFELRSLEYTTGSILWDILRKFNINDSNDLKLPISIIVLIVILLLIYIYFSSKNSETNKVKKD